MLLVMSPIWWSWSIITSESYSCLLWFFSFLEDMYAKYGYHRLIKLANKHWNEAWNYVEWITLLRCGEFWWLLEPWLFPTQSNLARPAESVVPATRPFIWVILVRVGTSHVAFLVALALGGAAAMLGGCNVYYVWEPRVFMTPPKNPMVYERLYV